MKKKRNSDNDYDVYYHLTSDRNSLSPHKALGIFIAGVVMLIVGLYILSQKVLVHSSFFSSGLHIRGFHLNTGLVIIPLIAGVVWMFVSPKNWGGRILSVIGVLIIIASIIMSTTFHLLTMSLFDWILILVLIFGGGGMVLRVLIAK